ncbi:MAG: DsbA family protein [Paracoccaceae bacterium]
MTPIRVDIVSDVVCPWCIIGFLQLQSAATSAQIGCEVYWHPFELNPQMPTEGQDLREHLAEKYGTTTEQSEKSRDMLKQLGDGLGFTFTYSDNLRMWNTFLAHQMIYEAGLQGKSHLTKLALFKAHFTDNRPIGEVAELVKVAEEVGLDVDPVKQALENGTHVEAVRKEQAFWIEQGISGVPAMVFDQKYLITGAQGPENYARILQTVVEKRAA